MTSREACAGHVLGKCTWRQQRHYRWEQGRVPGRHLNWQNGPGLVRGKTSARIVKMVMLLATMQEMSSFTNNKQNKKILAEFLCSEQTSWISGLERNLCSLGISSPNQELAKPSSGVQEKNTETSSFIYLIILVGFILNASVDGWKCTPYI